METRWHLCVSDRETQLWTKPMRHERHERHESASSYSKVVYFFTDYDQWTACQQFHIPLYHAATLPGHASQTRRVQQPANSFTQVCKMMDPPAWWDFWLPDETVGVQVRQRADRLNDKSSVLCTSLFLQKRTMLIDLFGFDEAICCCCYMANVIFQNVYLSM